MPDPYAGSISFEICTSVVVFFFGIFAISSFGNLITGGLHTGKTLREVKWEEITEKLSKPEIDRLALPKYSAEKELLIQNKFKKDEEQLTWFIVGLFMVLFFTAYYALFEFLNNTTGYRYILLPSILICALFGYVIFKSKDRVRTLDTVYETTSWESLLFFLGNLYLAASFWIVAASK